MVLTVLVDERFACSAMFPRNEAWNFSLPLLGNRFLFVKVTVTDTLKLTKDVNLSLPVAAKLAVLKKVLPDLKVGKPEAAQVAGIKGRTILVTANKFVDFFAYPTGNMHLREQTTARYYVLPMDGPDLTVIVLGETPRFDEEFVAAKAVIDTLTIATT